ETLPQLFAGKSQLIVYHFMLGPGWVQGCPSCSFLADHFDGAVVHLAQRDVTLVVVSRAPFAEIEAYKKRMGWTFKWVSWFANDFNRDFHVSFTPEEKQRGKSEYNYTMMEFPSQEAPGLSAFIKSETGEVLHTYSSYARGLDILVGTYNFLDMAPNGRDENALPWSMAWVRRHDEYQVTPPKAGCCGGWNGAMRTNMEDLNDQSWCFSVGAALRARPGPRPTSALGTGRARFTLPGTADWPG